jgi:hypothetical protein
MAVSFRFVGYQNSLSVVGMDAGYVRRAGRAISADVGPFPDRRLEDVRTAEK